MTARPATRLDPAESYRRHVAEVVAARSPEDRAFAASLAAEISVSRRLRDLREALGLSQREIATITGEDQADISRLERGLLNPSVERLNRILARVRAYVEDGRAAAPDAAAAPLTTAPQAARYLCAIADDADTEFTILKVLKLLYYAQGYALAILRRPLFPEAIKAWKYGPVLPGVRAIYKDVAGRIPHPEGFDPATVDPDVAAILDRVYAEYRTFTASELVDRTHDERPWAETPINGVISNALMAEFFTERLKPAGA